MSSQPDLFAPELPDGLAYREEVIDGAEEKRLIRAIGALELEPFRFQGWTGKRLTTSFGWHYDFDNARVAAAVAMPDWLLEARERAAGFAGVAADALVHALVTRYDPGAGIGWHRDRPIFEHVVGLSLGAPAVLRLRRRIAGGFERRALPLAPRSAYQLRGAARYEWEHGISPIAATRWSITFRSLSDKGRIATGSAGR